MISIRISEQTLTHHRQSGVSLCYPVSTAARGTGNQRDSLQTPLGRHRIAKKIGADMPLCTAFIARSPVGIYEPASGNPDKDWILSRILWLEGMQTGLNRRGPVDTLSRFIYIHGTHQENLIGTPASHGCIRMRNTDVLQLFSHTREGETVYIRP